MESLESKLALTTAFLGVVPVGGGPDLQVLGVGENDADDFTLQTLDAASGFSGHVLAEITNLNVPGGRLFGAYDVSGLQATAAANGGEFKGFNMYGLAGNDNIDASQLKNLEITTLNGDGRSDLGLPVDASITDRDTLTGGMLSRDRYYGGTDATTADGKNNDVVQNADVLDTVPVISPPAPQAFTPAIDGGTGSNTLTFNPDSAGVSIAPTTFSTINGTNGNDNIDASGTSGKVTINGLNGDDVLTGTGGDDTINGGEGKDTISGLGGKDNLSGGSGDDSISGGDQDDTINGNDGNDSLSGDGGKDTINGGVGNDFLDGGDGNDTLRGNEDNDVLRGSAGDDNIDGGPGTDTADYSTSPAGVDVRLNEGKAENDGFGNKDTLTSIEDINGSAFNDKLSGDDGDNLILGNDGNDDILGRGGNDTLLGGNNDDRINGGAGDDTILGESGNDRLLGRTGDDMLSGGQGDDTLFGEGGIDRLEGGLGSDYLDGGLGSDYLEGGPLRPGDADATDFVVMNYDLGRAANEDLAAVGGAALRDEFKIQTLEFATKIGNTDIGPYDPQQKLGGAMSQSQRIDAQAELSLDNVIGELLLMFTDFDGGDGVAGDTLEFFS